MIKLEANERIDWFFIFCNLKQNGYSVYDVSREIGIPESTMRAWKSKTCRPKFEEAVKLIELWRKVTQSDVEKIPIYNVYRDF